MLRGYLKLKKLQPYFVTRQIRVSIHNGFHRQLFVTFLAHTQMRGKAAQQVNSRSSITVLAEDYPSYIHLFWKNEDALIEKSIEEN